jgi:hypothetical protein
LIFIIGIILIKRRVLDNKVWLTEITW